MANEPIKLKENLYLYSGDIITINNSKPLLIEIINDQAQIVKLRSIKKNAVFPKDNYLFRKKLTFDKSALDFSTDFKNALTFTIKKNDDGEISLQTNSEYLESNKKDFHLSSEERWLVITKPKNADKIANYEEVIVINPHKEREVRAEKLPIYCESYDNKRGDTTTHTFEFTEERQVEHSFAWSTDFTWGVSTGLKLDFSSIGGLEISGNLEEKFGTSNSIKETKTTTIAEKYDVDCPPRTKVQVKLEAKKIKTPYTAKVKRLIDRRPYEYLIAGEYSRDDYSSRTWSDEEITVRNILLVGWTGSGKSTLANVLSSGKGFVESNKSKPETKWGKKSKEFEWKGNYYCVIDNIGFGDTEVGEKEELMRIGYAINEAYQGLSHVLFVYKKRFSDKEKEAFGKLEVLKLINPLITIVRSNFDNFESKKECERDSESLKKESSEEIRKVFNSCRGFLHVNNDKKDKDSRNASRKIVLDHLHDGCPSSPFKPKEWDDITSLIEDYFAKRKELESKKVQANTIQKEEAIKQQIDDLETDTAEQVRKEIQGNEIFQLAQIIQETK